MRNRPDIISTDKASSHPLRPGRFYNGTVTSVSGQGMVTLRVNDLGITVGPVLPLGTTPLNKSTVGDAVQCTFTDEFFSSVVVFGSSKLKDDIWASKELFEELVDLVESLVDRVDTLESQVSSLQSQLNSHSH